MPARSPGIKEKAAEGDHSVQEVRKTMGRTAVTAHVPGSAKGSLA